MTDKHRQSLNLSGMLFNRSLIVVILTTLGLLPLLTVTGYYLNPHDATTQMYPFIIETKRMFASGAPLWSWDTYLGDNFIGSYSYYTITSPFVWLCCAAPLSLMPLAFTLCLYIKFLVCAWVTNKYLKSLGFGDTLCIIGSLLYTFSGWSICNLAYYFFLEPMIAFPLVLLCIERFICNKRYKYTGLILSLAAAALINFYFIPCTFIGAFIYFIFRYPGRNQSTGHILASYVKYILCNITAVLMACIIILPVLMHLQDSPRITASASSSLSVLFERSLTLILPKHVMGPYGLIIIEPYWDCLGITLAVFGILPLVLMIIKRDINWAVKLSITLVIIYVTPLNGIFSLFTNPDYCRWCYVLEMSLIVTTLYYLQRYRTIHLRDALIYGAVCTSVFIVTLGGSWAYHLLKTPYSYSRMLEYALLLIMLVINIGALIYYALRPGRYPYRTALVLVSVCILVQMSARSVSDADKSSDDWAITNRKALTQTSIGTVSHTGLVRYDYCLADTFPIPNLSSVYGTPSVEYYHSIRNSKYRDIAAMVSHHVSYPYFLFPIRHHESFDALMSVGAIVYPANLSDSAAQCLPRHAEGRVDGIFKVAEFTRYIPFGFSYDRYAIVDGHQPITNASAIDTDYPAAMLNTLLIRAEDEAILSQYVEKADFHDSLPLDSLVDSRRKVTCQQVRPSSTGFVASIDSDRDRVVFFSVAADPGFTAYIDGVKSKIYEVNMGMCAVIVPEGHHAIEFRYFTPGLKAGTLITLIALICTILVYISERKRQRLWQLNGQ